MKKNKNFAFTLIELLVVIAIISLLSSIVLASLNSARSKARDARRKADMRQIVTALEMYYDNNNTYVIPGTGYNGCSCGWFNHEGGAYAKSVARGLEEAGLFPKAPADPTGATSGDYGYMKYQCAGGFFVYAHLDNPSAEDLATYTNSKALGCPNLDTYGKNYAVGHK